MQLTSSKKILPVPEPYQLDDKPMPSLQNNQRILR